MMPVNRYAQPVANAAVSENRADIKEEEAKQGVDAILPTTRPDVPVITTVRL